MKNKVLAMFLILTILSLGVKTYATTISDYQSQQKQTQDEKDKAKENLQSVTSEKNTVQEQVSTLNESISEVQADLSDLQDKIDELDKSVDNKQKELDEKQKLLEERLVASYMNGSTTYMDALFSGGISNFISNYETIKQIAKRLNIPYTIEDATKYTQEGYYGADVNEMILNLLENANMDIKKAQNGIIVIDEIDKKAGHEVSHDVAGTEVLKSLLKIIEGTTIKVPVEMDYYNVKLADFDTKNIIIIFLGAFSGLDIIRDKRLNSNPLGFSIKEETHKSKAKFLKQDLVKYGLPEEFVGRIDTIVEMNELTKKDLALILKKSELSIFKRYQNELSNMGITLIYNDDLFESIAEKSLVLDTGARELSNTVNYMFENIVFDVLSNPNKYKKCILDSEIAQDNTKYTLS